jgi:hypothetical protein
MSKMSRTVQLAPKEERRSSQTVEQEDYLSRLRYNYDGLCVQQRCHSQITIEEQKHFLREGYLFSTLHINVFITAEKTQGLA